MELSRTPDVVVIGSGAGGASVAWGLVSQGAEVLLLEAGPRFDPSVDYPQDRSDWERHAFPQKPGSRTQVVYGDLGILNADDLDLMRWSKVAGRDVPVLGRARVASGGGYSHVMGVGGSTLHFVGEAHRLHPDAFRLHSLTDAGVDWPMSYQALEPYYSKIEHAIGVAGTDAGPGRVQSREFPMPAHPLSPGAGVLAEAGRKIGRPWAVNPRAVNSRVYDERPACNYCGQCSRGCPLGDKASMDVSLLRRAMDSGRLTIVSEAQVTRLLLGNQGVISAVEVVSQGQKHRVETPQVVLAAGAVNSPRLLLVSANAEQPDGIANGSGQVGRNFMETLWWNSAGLLPGLRNSHMGLPADATDWSMAHPTSVPGLAGGYKLTHTTLDTGLNGPIGYAARLLPGFGAEWKAQMRARFGSAVSVGAVGQVIADERSKVSLDPEQVDAFGMALPRIDSVLTGNSLALLREMARGCREVLSSAGVEIAEETSNWDAFQSTHVFGTARMGLDSAEAVVDGQGRSFDHPNLWIADASVFPSSGAGEAPSLTIMALAARTADAILAG